MASNTNRSAVMFKEAILTQLGTTHVTTKALRMPFDIKGFNYTPNHPSTASITHRCKVDSVTVVAVGPVFVLVEYTLWKWLETLHTYKAVLMPVAATS
jgi:hypothetical protein